jgi:hypothetical protein
MDPRNRSRFIDDDEETPAEQEQRATARMVTAARIAAIAREELGQGEVDEGWWTAQDALALYGALARKWAELGNRDRVLECWKGYVALVERFEPEAPGQEPITPLLDRARMALANWEGGNPGAGPALSRELEVVVDFVSREYDFMRASPCACGGHWRPVVQRCTDKTDTDGGYLMHDEIETRCDFCGIGRTFYFAVRYELEDANPGELPCLPET